MLYMNNLQSMSNAIRSLSLDAIAKAKERYLENLDFDFTDKEEYEESLDDEWEDEESPLKDTFQIKVKDAKSISKTAKQIKKIDKVAVVKYGEGMVEQLVSVFDTIRKGSVAVVIALILVTAFLIANTIKITIFACQFFFESNRCNNRLKRRTWFKCINNRCCS